MKLYLKLDRPGGKRFVFLDPITRQFNYKKVVFLYPEKPTEVATEFAQQLLERDPHLVSKDVYDAKKDPKLLRIAEIEKENKANQGKYNPETTEERITANARFMRRDNKGVQPPKDAGLDQAAEEKVITEKVILESGEDPMQYVEILAQVSELNKEQMTIDSIRHFGKLVGCHFKGKKRDGLLKQFDARCEELTGKIEKYMETGPEGYLEKEAETGNQVDGPSNGSALPEASEKPDKAPAEETEEAEK